jgi:2-phospho-L-lactate guanylyltransferase
LRDIRLNAAVALAATAAGGPPIAVVPADLPALRPVDLAAALRAAPAGTLSYVADAAGTGTVLLAAADPEPLVPRFGPDSARAHTRAGAVPLLGDWPSLRRDVDTAADLAAATILGLGRYTATLLGVAFK